MDFSFLRVKVRVSVCLGMLGIALILLNSPLRAWAWGCDGHQAVALIAEKHMSAHALEQVNRLLRSVPIDSTLLRRCSSEGLDPMADAATWADDVRPLRPEASPWHYINIPRGAHRAALEDYCPATTGCVTSAIEHQISVLRGQSADMQERADALRFLIHFVGDFHQPLHCVSNNDLGGSCVPVNFLGDAPVERNLQAESYSPNLHSIWDSSILDRVKGWQSIGQWSAKLDRQFSSQAKSWEQAGIHLDDWAWEGHELGELVVYAKLPVAIPVEEPLPIRGCYEDRHVSTRILKLHERVSQKYVDAVAPTINGQIAKAGVRLAMILNQIWR